MILRLFGYLVLFLNKILIEIINENKITSKFFVALVEFLSSEKGKG